MRSLSTSENVLLCPPAFETNKIIKPQEGFSLFRIKSLKNIYLYFVKPSSKMFIPYLATLRRGWLVPSNFRKCDATLATSSLNNHLKLRNDVG